MRRRRRYDIFSVYVVVLPPSHNKNPQTCTLSHHYIDHSVLLCVYIYIFCFLCLLYYFFVYVRNKLQGKGQGQDNCQGSKHRAQRGLTGYVRSLWARSLELWQLSWLCPIPSGRCFFRFAVETISFFFPNLCFLFIFSSYDSLHCVDGLFCA